MRHPSKEKVHQVFLDSYIKTLLASHIGYIGYIGVQFCSKITFIGIIFNIIPMLVIFLLYNEKNCNEYLCNIEKCKHLTLKYSSNVRIVQGIASINRYWTNIVLLVENIKENEDASI